MTIWKLWAPQDLQFAYFDGTGRYRDREGTWKDPDVRWETIADRYRVCRECTAARPFECLPGLTIEWKPCSDRIGDFSWDESGCWPVLKDNVFNELHCAFQGFAAAPIEMTQNPKAKRPMRITKRSKPRVWLPYEGPKLHQLWVTKVVPMDTDRSTARLVRQCSLCGRKRYELDGAEQIEGHWDKERRVYLQVRRLREPGKGLFVRSQDIADADVFRVRELYGWDYCTDRVKRFIEERGYTNIDFFEMGEVV